MRSTRLLKYRSLLSATSLLVSTTLALACGDDDSGSDGGSGVADAATDGGGSTTDGGAVLDGTVPADGGAGMPIADYCARAPALWCRWLEDCRGIECEQWFGGGTVLGATSTTWCTDIAARVSAGAVGYDPVRAAECLALQEENVTACTGSGPLHRCNPFSGRSQPGTDCYLPFPLTGGECDVSLGRCTAARFEERCPGTCQAYAALSTPCVGGTAICAPDAFCDETTGCTARPGEGAACEGACAESLTCVTIAPGDDRCVRLGEPGDPCASDQPCDSESTCVAGTCVDAVPRGQPCEGSGQCEETDYCLSNLCTALPALGDPCDTSGRCVEGACAPNGDGELTCQAIVGDGDLCDPGVCDDDLWCQHGGTENRCRPPGGSGVDCSGEAAWVQAPRCSEGLFCSGGGTCSEFLAAGTPCDPARVDPQCDRDSGVYCDVMISECLAPPTTAGARCIQACGDGLWCNAGMCEAKVALRDECVDSRACPERTSCTAFSDDPTRRCRAVSACSSP